MCSCACLRRLGICLRPDPAQLQHTRDLSAFAMPLLDGDATDGNLMDSGEFRGRPRSSSGSSAFKGLLGGKSKHRNKSAEREEKDKKEKDGSSKMKSFLDTFRPRSKSDVSTMQRPKKKPQVQMDHSMDESTLSAQVNQANGSQEVLTPMGQILEGQMLHVHDDDTRLRHKSGGANQGGKDGFMSKFRTRSNSDSKPKSPRKPLQSQKSFSPPNSPRLADRSALSPLRLQSGEPKSAPPGGGRGSFSNDGHTHAIIYKTDVLNRLSVDSDRMEIEDLDENEDLIYVKFMKTHKCYDLIPTSAKLVIFDTQLNVKKAFFALVYNGVRSAPLWDTEKQDYVGMLTITDFINILKQYYKSPERKIEELEDHKISTWREVLKEKQKSFVSCCPDTSLFDAVKTLVDCQVHRLPVIDEATGNALYIITHKRLLRFMHLFIKDLPHPLYMKKSIKELGIGTYENVMTATPDMTLIDVLNLFCDHRISALPVVDKNSGKVIGIYAKFDVINLAAEKTYNNLDITLEEALNRRFEGGVQGLEKVASCKSSDSLEDVVNKIVKAEVHRLVVIDDNSCVEGIVSLSDLLNYTVLRPVEEISAPSSS